MLLVDGSLLVSQQLRVLIKCITAVFLHILYIERNHYIQPLTLLFGVGLSGLTLRGGWQQSMAAVSSRPIVSYLSADLEGLPCTTLGLFRLFYTAHSRHLAVYDNSLHIVHKTVL